MFVNVSTKTKGNYKSNSPVLILPKIFGVQQFIFINIVGCCSLCKYSTFFLCSITFFIFCSIFTHSVLFSFQYLLHFLNLLNPVLIPAVFKLF